MIFGAHLMPFSWLYQSRSYLVFSIVIPIAALIVGLIYSTPVLAAMMFVFETIFSWCLYLEVRQLFRKSES